MSQPRGPAPELHELGGGSRIALPRKCCGGEWDPGRQLSRPFFRDGCSSDGGPEKPSPGFEGPTHSHLAYFPPGGIGSAFFSPSRGAFGCTLARRPGPNG